MPRRQPFTLLCQHAATLARPRLADLHTHTTASDGDFTPSQVVAFAVQAGLKAVAITDHDTMAGVNEAQAAIRENRSPIELVRGVEMSTFEENRDYHLLAYDVRPNEDFEAVLRSIQHARRSRFDQFIRVFEEQGLALSASDLEQLAATPSLGRRHLAQLLIRSGIVKSHHDAFRRYVLPAGEKVGRLRVVAMKEAIERTHAAGGVASLAHPSPEIGLCDLSRFREAGLDAVEVVFPAVTHSRSTELRRWAVQLGLGCTGGSDCHGPDRRVGSKTIPVDELSRLRQSATSAGCAGTGEQASSASLRG